MATGRPSEGPHARPLQRPAEAGGPGKGLARGLTFNPVPPAAPH